MTAWPVKLVLLLALAEGGASQPSETRPDPAGDRAALELPLKEGSLRFAVIGDSGTGGAAQTELARKLAEWRAVFPFELVLMLGDNIYGKDDARDYRLKFEEPYRALLDAGVKFYAALGNHDDPKQRFYEKFHMGGERYYSFKGSQGKVRFFALDSNYLDKPQLEWLEKQLDASGEDWKICFFHHPLYSSGKKHGPSEELREVLEPVLLKHGVDVVLQGHEHFYERMEPQQGIHYFISGAAGQLRRSNIGKSDITARGFDQDLHFMLVEIVDDAMYFQTISRAGATVDKGALERPPEPPKDQKSSGR